MKNNGRKKENMEEIFLNALIAFLIPGYIADT